MSREFVEEGARFVAAPDAFGGGLHALPRSSTARPLRLRRRGKGELLAELRVLGVHLLKVGQGIHLLLELLGDLGQRHAHLHGGLRLSRQLFVLGPQVPNLGLLRRAAALHFAQDRLMARVGRSAGLL